MQIVSIGKKANNMSSAEKFYTVCYAFMAFFGIKDIYIISRRSGVCSGETIQVFE